MHSPCCTHPVPFQHMRKGCQGKAVTTGNRHVRLASRIAVTTVTKRQSRVLPFGGFVTASPPRFHSGLSAYRRLYQSCEYLVAIVSSVRFLSIASLSTYRVSIHGVIIYLSRVYLSRHYPSLFSLLFVTPSIFLLLISFPIRHYSHRSSVT